MRYLALFVLVSCGPAIVETCKAAGCPSGKQCNVNTGVCVAKSGAGGGVGGSGGGISGTGGGSSGVGGGTAGGAAGGGGSSAMTSVRISWDLQSCDPATCSDCSVSNCAPAAKRVRVDDLNAWKTGRYAGCTTTTGAIDSLIDCTGNCHETTEPCADVTGTVQRKTQTCVLPDGVASGCAWTP